MVADVFSYSMRSFVCFNCGAPLAIPIEGGVVTCEYCRVSAQIEKRPEPSPQIVNDSPPPKPLGDEPNKAHVSRIERLRRQLDNETANRYQLDWPHDIEVRLRGLKGAEKKLPIVKRAWDETRNLLLTAKTQETAMRFFVLTIGLRQLAFTAGELSLSRSVVETALYHIDDPIHQHSLRALMARAAVEAGEPNAAESWIEGCDSEPEILQADSDYRIAKARLAIARNEFETVLEILGKDLTSIPISPNNDILARLYRMHAHDTLGNKKDADQQMLDFCSIYGGRLLRTMVKCHGGIAASVSKKAHRSASLVIIILGACIGLILGTVVGAGATLEIGLATGLVAFVVMPLMIIGLIRIFGKVERPFGF